MSSNSYNVADVVGWRLNYHGESQCICLLTMKPGSEEQQGVFEIPLAQVPDVIRALSQVCRTELPNDSAV